MAQGETTDRDGESYFEEHMITMNLIQLELLITSEHWWQTSALIPQRRHSAPDLLKIDFTVGFVISRRRWKSRETDTVVAVCVCGADYCINVTFG